MRTLRKNPLPLPTLIELEETGTQDNQVFPPVALYPALEPKSSKRLTKPLIAALGIGLTDLEKLKPNDLPTGAICQRFVQDDAGSGTRGKNQATSIELAEGYIRQAINHLIFLSRSDRKQWDKLKPAYDLIMDACTIFTLLGPRTNFPVMRGIDCQLPDRDVHLKTAIDNLRLATYKICHIRYSIDAESAIEGYDALSRLNLKP